MEKVKTPLNFSKHISSEIQENQLKTFFRDQAFFLLQMEEENEIEYMFEINFQKQFILLLKCFDRKISEATCSPLNFVVDLAISINTGGQAVAATTCKMVSSLDELVTIAYATFYENYFVRKQIKSRVFLDLSQRQNMKYFKKVRKNQNPF